MIRKDENKIKKKIEIKGTKSSNFIKKYIDNDNKIIIKIDIEGSELDFLKGLEQYNFDQIDAFVVEAHLTILILATLISFYFFFLEREKLLAIIN